VFFTPPQGQALRVWRKIFLFPFFHYPGERIFSPKPCTAEHYLFLAPETRILLTDRCGMALKKSQKS
jgi:hypothetical protein